MESLSSLPQWLMSEVIELNSKKGVTRALLHAKNLFLKDHTKRQWDELKGEVKHVLLTHPRRYLGLDKQPKAPVLCPRCQTLLPKSNDLGLHRRLCHECGAVVDVPSSRIVAGKYELDDPFRFQEALKLKKTQGWTGGEVAIPLKN